ncbi:hypothetical protein AURDEDRAFT_164005 [Auricularia subglabra TFB-10046 SS5]|nr:hypothetical protein AURDEDRAFT_164005 [Auricularia subglabra TFB-10046 SS5]
MSFSMEPIANRLGRVLEGEMSIWRFIDYLTVAMGTHPSYLYYEGFLCTLVCQDEFKHFCNKRINNYDALMATVRDLEEEIARVSELYQHGLRTTLLQRFRASHAIAHIGSKFRRTYFAEERELILRDF